MSAPSDSSLAAAGAAILADHENEHGNHVMSTIRNQDHSRLIGEVPLDDLNRYTM